MTMSKNTKRRSRIYLKSSLMLIDAQLEFLERRREQRDVDDAELNDINIWYPLLEGEFAKLDGQYTALRRGSPGIIKPPTDDQVEAILDLSDEMDDLIDSRLTTSSVINITTKLFKVVNEVNSA